MNAEVVMRATAGHIVDKAGAYRCLCCGRRQIVRDRDTFERCKGCQCSIFEPDWRCADPLELSDIMHKTDQSDRPWSMS